MNILATSIGTFGGFGKVLDLNFIGKIIMWLIESFGSIGLGIIIFTLALKLITLPLDIISRVSMKKSALKMQLMAPKLEKLQRQYANNKELYNKKIQALYKEQGYSMFSTCLPMLVSIAIFFMVISQFNHYSNFSEWRMLNDMSAAYTSAIEQYYDNVVYKERDASGNIVKREDGTFVAYLNENYVFDSAEEFSSVRTFVVKTPINEYSANYLTSDTDKLAALVKELNQKGFTLVTVRDESGENVSGTIIKSADGKYIFNSAEFGSYDDEGNFTPLSDDEINAIVTGEVVDYLMNDYLENNVLFAARTASKECYQQNSPRFLWIKNLWKPDLPFKHPVANKITEYSFASNTRYGAKADDKQFKEITMFLGVEKTRANGYLVLIVLSIGLMLMSQLISQKSQKAQLQYQSVDGSNAASSKMMTWIMPIMFGVFSFLYSAAFSIYMVVSTAFSILSTIIINFAVEKAFKTKYGA